MFINSLRPSDAYISCICVNKLSIIGSDNGLSPSRHQAIIWTNDGILLIWPPGTNFNKMLIEIHTFSFKKMQVKVPSAKWRPFCLGLNVLMTSKYAVRHFGQYCSLNYSSWNRLHIYQLIYIYIKSMICMKIPTGITDTHHCKPKNFQCRTPTGCTKQNSCTMNTLTPWGLVAHSYPRPVITSTGSGLSPVWCKATASTNETQGLLCECT